MPRRTQLKTKMSSIKEKMEVLVRQKQKEIVSGLETLDTEKFRADSWTKPGNGGGGVSCVIQEGTCFEKGGVNISIVNGILPPQAIQQMRADHKSMNTDNTGSVGFYACGLSMVLHPYNPMAPTVHMNYRYFETTNPDGSTQAWWFGGGADLTPSYLFEEDAIHFHKQLKYACDKHDPQYYPKFKKWCDEYFFIKHREESRGIGGIFFDDLDDKTPGELLSFVTDCFDAFLPAYLPIMRKRKDLPYTPEEKKWQQLRRGRYVEFNLVIDRGTKFGLMTPGSRVESILMSLPVTASWLYDHHPEKGTREDQLLQVLKNPRQWI